MSPLQTLPAGPKGKVPEVRNAHRFLRGAHDSVSGLFVTFGVLSSTRRSTNPTASGRSHRDEVDLLRSAIVLTSSGLDATMKRLVNDAGRYLLSESPKKESTGAWGAYNQYLMQQLAAPKVEQPLKLAIAGSDPQLDLLTYYLRGRSAASFQGSNDLISRVRGVLGISKNRITDAQLKALDPFFTARNEIAHSMDFIDVAKSMGRARQHRSETQVAAMCDLVFDTTSDLIHATAEVILAAR